MKFKYFFIFLLMTFLTANAQVDDEFYKKLLDKEFTKILTGQNTNFGNFASLGTKDDIASLAGNVKIGEFSNLGINLKGGVTEGLVPLLNGEDVNSNLGLNLQLNLGLYRDLRNVIEMNATQRANFQYSIDSLDAYIVKTKREIVLLKEKTELEVKQKREKLNKLELIKLPENDLVRRQIKSDSIALQKKLLQIEIEDLQAKADKINDNENARQFQNLDERYVSFYNSRFEKLLLLSYTIDWFSFHGKLNNRTFNSFDPSMNYDDQIDKINFNQIEVGFAYNIYQVSQDSCETFFFSVGASYLLDDNFDDLTKKTLNDKQDITGAPVSRSITETKTIYLGEYKDNLSHLKISSNLYWFPTYNQSFAIHLEPICRANFKDKIKFDGTVGLLVGFKNEEKDKNIINVELYYNMKDFFKKSENDDDEFTDRSSLGLKLNFPITFKR